MLNFEMQYTTTYYFSNFGNLSSALGIRHVFFIKLSHDHEPYILMHAKFVSGAMYLLPNVRTTYSYFQNPKASKKLHTPQQCCMYFLLSKKRDIVRFWKLHLGQYNFLSEKSSGFCLYKKLLYIELDQFHIPQKSLH